jgi:hypothetical protein
MSIQPAATTRPRRYLPLLVLVVLAGCGSSQSAGDASKPTLAGVEAAARRWVTAVQSAHYPEACEAFTAEAQAVLKREEPGGCLGSIAFLYGALSGQVSKFFEKVVPKLEIEGGVARIRHCIPSTATPASAKCSEVVYARYEHGQWRVQTSIL